MSKHYIDNKKFLEVLTKYQDDSRKAKLENKEKPPIPNYIGDCFIKIAEHLSHKPNFINYSFRDEMIGDAIENCLMYFENFDAKKSSNPFSYFTQIVFYAFLRRIAKESKNQYVKYKMFQNQMVSGEDFFGIEETGLQPVETYANISEFTRNYELKQKKKKKTAKKKGVEKFYNEQ